MDDTRAPDRPDIGSLPERRWTLQVAGTELARGCTREDGTFLLLAGSRISVRARASNRDIADVVALRAAVAVAPPAVRGSSWATLSTDTIVPDAGVAATVVLGTPAPPSQWTAAPGRTDATDPAP